VQYKEREGDHNVPFYHVEDDQKLGLWLVVQRKNKKNGKIDESREERLNDLGVQRGDVCLISRRTIQGKRRRLQCSIPPCRRWCEAWIVDKHPTPKLEEWKTW
jgi:hypothetical protein